MKTGFTFSNRMKIVLIVLLALAAIAAVLIIRGGSSQASGTDSAASYAATAKTATLATTAATTGTETATTPAGDTNSSTDSVSLSSQSAAQASAPADPPAAPAPVASTVKPVKLRMMKVNPEVISPGGILSFFVYLNGRSNPEADVHVKIYKRSNGVQVMSWHLVKGGCGGTDDCEWKASMPGPSTKGEYYYVALADGTDGSHDELSGIAYTFCVGNPAVDCQ